MARNERATMKQVVLALVLMITVAGAAAAQSVTMTTAQKVQLTVASADAGGQPVPLPKTQTMLQWSADCESCTFTGLAYDATARTYAIWFVPGDNEFGAFTVSLTVTVGGTERTTTLAVTVNEVVVIPATVRIVAGTPVAK